MLCFDIDIAFFLNLIVGINYLLVLYDGGVIAVIWVTLFFVKWCTYVPWYLLSFYTTICNTEIQNIIGLVNILKVS